MSQGQLVAQNFANYITSAREVFINGVNIFWKTKLCTKYPSFIPLEIEQNLPNNSCRDEIRVYSSLKVSNSSGLTIEFAEGCKLLELNAIIGVINATK